MTGRRRHADRYSHRGPDGAMTLGLLLLASGVTALMLLAAAFIAAG